MNFFSAKQKVEIKQLQKKEMFLYMYIVIPNT